MFPSLGEDEATFELVTSSRTINLWADNAKQRDSWAEHLAQFSGEAAAPVDEPAAAPSAAAADNYLRVSLTPALSGADL